MLRLWRRYGVYLKTNANRGRYTPIYMGMAIMGFLGGAGVEYAMAEWRPNGINFYDVYKEKLARDIADEREAIEKAGPAVLRRIQEANKK